MDKTLECTLKESINTAFPTCDDKGVFKGGEGGGCDMGLLSAFSLVQLLDL